jgi:hypothetical protein
MAEQESDLDRGTTMNPIRTGVAKFSSVFLWFAPGISFLFRRRRPVWPLGRLWDSPMCRGAITPDSWTIRLEASAM